MVIDIPLYLKVFLKQILLSLHIINKTLRELLFSRNLKLVWKIWLGNTGKLFAKNLRRSRPILFHFWNLINGGMIFLGLYYCYLILLPIYLAGIIIADSLGIIRLGNLVWQQPHRYRPTSQYLLVLNTLIYWNNAFQLQSQMVKKQHLGDLNNVHRIHRKNLEKVPSLLNICSSHYLMFSFYSSKVFCWCRSMHEEKGGCFHRRWTGERIWDKLFCIFIVFTCFFSSWFALLLY